MLQKKIHFIPFMLPLMTLCAGLDGAEIKMHSVTPRMYHTEEPHYDLKSQRLFFSDQYGQKFCAYDLRLEKTTCISQGLPTGVIVPIAHSEDQFAAAVGHYFGILKWDGVSPHSNFTILRNVRDDGCGRQLLNDGKADKNGRLWTGTEGQDAEWKLIQNQGNVYHYAPETCSLNMKSEKVTVANGFVWNLDYTKFYMTSCNQYQVDVFDYDLKTGEISNRQPFLDFKAKNMPGEPHGMTIDTDGNLWVACFKGHQIIKVDPRSGKVLKTIKLPVSVPTAVAWGGPHLDVLMVTTTRKLLNEEEQSQQPWAGTVIAITGLKERGLPPNDAVICQRVETYSVKEAGKDDDHCTGAGAKPSVNNAMNFCQN